MINAQRLGNPTAILMGLFGKESIVDRNRQTIQLIFFHQHF